MGIRWRTVIDVLPAALRTAILNGTSEPVTLEDDQLLQLDTNTMAVLQKELLETLSGQQVATIILHLQKTQRVRQGARVLELLGGSLEQDQVIRILAQIDYYQVLNFS